MLQLSEEQRGELEGQIKGLQQQANAFKEREEREIGEAQNALQGRIAQANATLQQMVGAIAVLQQLLEDKEPVDAAQVAWAQVQEAAAL